MLLVDAISLFLLLVFVLMNPLNLQCERIIFFFFLTYILSVISRMCVLENRQQLSCPLVHSSGFFPCPIKVWSQVYYSCQNPCVYPFDEISAVGSGRKKLSRSSEFIFSSYFFFHLILFAIRTKNSESISYWKMYLFIFAFASWCQFHLPVFHGFPDEFYILFEYFEHFRQSPKQDCGNIS